MRGEADRVRRVGDRLGTGLWVVAGGALVFTMSNVTLFAVDHHTPWQIAWLLDPLASLALLMVLVGDGVLSRHGMAGGGWARAVKFGAGAATWAMNVWVSVAARDGAGVVLHSVAPALVIGLAEATPAYRARFAALADRLQADADRVQVEADRLAAQRQTLDQPESGPVPAEARTLDPTARTDARTLDRTRSRTGGRTVVDSPARTRGEGRARTGARTEAQSPARRTEEVLVELVRGAIAAGRLPAAPSGTAIQALLGGGKGPAVRVAARLAAGVSATDPAAGAGRAAGEQPDPAGGLVVRLVPQMAEAAS